MYLSPILLLLAAMRGGSPELAHVRNSFSLTVHTNARDAAALFGPEGERAWSGPEWNPQFLYPQPAKDIQGAVFTVKHGSHDAVWVNTLFDVAAGRLQYAVFIPDAMVTTITIELTATAASETKAVVIYERTALTPEANEHVEMLGKRDASMGPEWERSLNKYLSR
jgi:hypothetical protein